MQAIQEVLMNKCTIELWGRRFTLPLVYECYDGETILPQQREALAMLQQNQAALDGSLEPVRKYVKKNGGGPDQAGLANVFRYVMPKTVFVPHSEKRLTAAILCAYKPDMEHGLAVIFENGRLRQVGPQDLVL